MAGIKIHQYPLERLIFGDDDYYDIDYWDGAGYQTAKIKGSVIKAAIADGNLFTDDLTLNSNRTHQLNANSFKINGGGFMQFGDVTANLLDGMIIDAQDFYVRTADPAGDGTFQTIGGSGWQARVVSNTGQYIGDLSISGPVLTGQFTDGGLGTNVTINPGLFIVSNDNGSDLVSFTLTNSNIQKMITDTATSNATLFVQDNTQIQSVADNQVSGTGSIIHQKADGLSISNFGASGKQVDLFWDNVNNKFTIEDRRITATGLEYWANYHASYTNRTLVDKEYVDNVAAAIDLNSLTDVTTGLPGTPTEADDGKILFYDHDTGQWITDDAVTHGTSVINCKKSTAGTIAKGLPVYLVGFDADLHTVELADATSGATMPVIGFTAEDLDNTNSKHVTTFGKLTGIDTTSTVSTLNPNGETWAVNDSLYISTTAGGLTKVRPTGGTTQIQRIAKVLKVDATGGQIFVFNTARTAGLPNLGTDKLWIGDANGIPQEVDKSTIGASLYTQDDTIGSGRVATLTDTLTFNGGSGAIFKLYSTLRTDDIFQVFFNGGGEWLAKNGTIDIGAGTTYSNYYTRFTETGIKSYGAGTLVHEINNVTGKVYFMNGYMSGQDFIIGSNATVGTENISLQGRTLVKGADTFASNTAFEIYDGDTAPTKLWDFRNNGDLTGWKSKTNLVAQNGTNNNLGEYVFRVSNFGNSSPYAIITNRGYFQFGISNSISNTDFSTCFQLGHSNSINSTSFYFGLIGQSNTLTGSGNDRYILGKGNNSSGGQEQVIIGVDNTVSGNFTSMIGSEGTLSGQFSSAIGRAHNITHQFSVGLGSWVQSGANGASIIGHGVEADKTQKLVNNTANSLALGWNSTTPTYLFASTGATVKVDLDMDNNRITNTIVNPTVQETTSAATFTINATNENTGVLTAQAVALTVANPTGTIVQGQKLVYRIKDNGTARAITWGANFRAIGVTLPTTTTANKLLYVGCIYNTTDSKWDVIAVNEEA